MASINLMTASELEAKIEKEVGSTIKGLSNAQVSNLNMLINHYYYRRKNGMTKQGDWCYYPMIDLTKEMINHMKAIGYQVKNITVESDFYEYTTNHTVIRTIPTSNKCARNE